MPSAKRDAKVPCGQRTKSPNRSSVQSGDSSLLLWWQSKRKYTYSFKNLHKKNCTIFSYHTVLSANFPISVKHPLFYVVYLWKYFPHLQLLSCKSRNLLICKSMDLCDWSSPLWFSWISPTVPMLFYKFWRPLTDLVPFRNFLLSLTDRSSSLVNYSTSFILCTISDETMLSLL